MGNKRIYFSFFVSLFFLSQILFLSCSSQLSFRYLQNKELARMLNEYQPKYPKIKFVVISDIHYYAPELGIDGKAFKDYLDKDRKLIAFSSALLKEALAEIEKEELSFLLVPGDLTKDGEKLSHEILAKSFQMLEDKGIKVYVVPGNHDVNNGHSYRYEGNEAIRVPNVTAQEFSFIYNNFGYKEAFARDNNSLSYAVEPVSGLWLIGLDACLYDKNKENEESHTGAEFKKETLLWLEDLLEQSVLQQKAVIAFIHHGIVEHYKSQEKYFAEYLVKDYKQIAKMLAYYKVRLVFTGHYHAQDITVWREEKSFIFDIETGSPVTYPCPYRFCEIIDNNELKLETRLIKKMPGVIQFQDYARSYLQEGIERIAIKTMKELGVPEVDFKILAPQIAEAFIAHYVGDEKLPEGKEALKMTGLSFMGSLVVGNRKSLIEGLWQDLPPKDNNLIINLSDGSWR